VSTVEDDEPEDVLDEVDEAVEVLLETVVMSVSKRSDAELTEHSTVQSAKTGF
jgi:hypothetical protein